MTCAEAAMSMSAEHEVLERIHECLEPKNQGVHECKRIYYMKSSTLQGASLFCRDFVVVVGVGVCEAAAASCHTIEPTFVERLKSHKKGAGPRDLLRFEQLLAAAELTCGNIVLHIRDHHRDNGPGFRCTG